MPNLAKFAKNLQQWTKQLFFAEFGIDKVKTSMAGPADTEQNMVNWWNIELHWIRNTSRVMEYNLHLHEIEWKYLLFINKNLAGDGYTVSSIKI